MRKLIFIFLFLITLLTSGCAIFKVYDPYYGTIIDETTQKPISGAVVLAEYTTDALTPAGSVSYFVSAEEAVTDKNGAFRIPLKLLFTFRPLNIWDSHPYIHIVKPGYGCFENMHYIIKAPKLNPNDKTPPWWSLPSWTNTIIALPINDLKNRREGCRYLNTCVFSDASGCNLTDIPYPYMRIFEKARYLEQIDLGEHEKHFTTNVDLSLAIRGNDYRQVKRLISSGIDVNVANETNYTSLMYACELGRVQIAELLISGGALINSQDESGKTPLIVALTHSQILGDKPVVNKAVQLLIYNNANLNLTDKWGATPLSEAVSRGYLEIVELLLRKGANVSVRGDKGRTVLAIAKGEDADKIRALLRSYGAHE